MKKIHLENRHNNLKTACGKQSKNIKMTKYNDKTTCNLCKKIIIS